MNKFDGKKIRDEILLKVRREVVESGKEYTLAVILTGDDAVSEHYIELKKKTAEKLGVCFSLYKFDEKDSENDVLECIKFLNSDPETVGIMMQVPVVKGMNRDKLIEAIEPKKDVDGLRFCLGLESKFQPPVVLAILEAMERAKVDFEKDSILLVGEGFLVGGPLKRIIDKKAKKLKVADIKTKNLKELCLQADVIVTAAGKSGLIAKDMVKDEVILIDAGTTEVGGELLGDINPASYRKASFYTPVPGGIGPVTIAMLFQNLIKKGEGL